MALFNKTGLEFTVKLEEGGLAEYRIENAFADNGAPLDFTYGVMIDREEGQDDASYLDDLYDNAVAMYLLQIEGNIQEEELRGNSLGVASWTLIKNFLEGIDPASIPKKFVI